MGELFSNDYYVTLSAAVSSSAAAINVSGPAPIASGFRVLIDSELALVTSGGTTTKWYVTRGVEKTTAASHSTGALIHLVLTSTSLTNIISQTSIQWAGAWSSGTTYAQYAVVYYTGCTYVSLQSSNYNNQPDISPTCWTPMFKSNMNWRSVYSPTAIYNKFDAVYFNGNAYTSMVAANLGNTPGPISPYWNLLTPSFSANTLIQDCNFAVDATGSYCVDKSGNGNTAWLYGCSLTGSGAVTDGSSAFINTGKAICGRYTWSVAIKFKTTSNSSGTYYYTDPYIYGMFLNGNQNDFGLTVHNGYLSVWDSFKNDNNDYASISSTLVNDNNFHLVVCVCDGNVLRLYCDGVPIPPGTSNGATSAAFNTSVANCIGDRPSNNQGGMFCPWLGRANSMDNYGWGVSYGAMAATFARLQCYGMALTPGQVLQVQTFF